MRKGDADVLLVHSPDDEAAFMAEGHGTLRLPFAYNHFVIAGPGDDPAGIARPRTATDAFAAIAESQEHVRLPRRRVGNQQEGAEALGRRGRDA